MLRAQALMDCLRVGRENDLQGRRFVAQLDIIGPE